MKQLRNWKEIAEIPCPETRYALAVCGHEGVKARLRFAFPECFIPARDDQTDLFSWRHLLEVAEHTQAKEDEARPPYPALAHMWLQYLQPALSDPNFAAFRGIPIKAQWGEMWWGGAHAECNSGGHHRATHSVARHSHQRSIVSGIQRNALCGGLYLVRQCSRTYGSIICRKD